MSFQWIVDRAETLSINRKNQVATTTARDGTVRSVDRGPLPDRITVKLPDGIPWTELKSYIEAAELLNKSTSASISIPYAKFPWFYNDVNPGTDTTWTVRCTQFPEWTIFARNQVSWSGAFVFIEVI